MGKEFFKQPDILTKVGFSDFREMTPTRRGVYALIAVPDIHRPIGTPWHEHVLYIGSSKNIYMRLANKSHIIHKIAERQDINDYLYVRWLLVDDYQEVERLLIRTIRPLLNKQCKTIRIKPESNG